MDIKGSFLGDKAARV